jgi:ketosteroid isomerase-like protein
MTDEDPDLRDHESVRKTNQLFYTAHENRDFDLMSSIWNHGPDVVCIHPGWPILRGWEAVGDSWRRIFDGPAGNQFIVTNVGLTIADGVAWITLDENLMSAGGTGTIAATNIFVRADDEWKLVLHHGSPVAAQRRQL